MKKIMILAAAVLMAATISARTWTEPVLTPADLDAARAEKTTDEAYLSTLNGLQDVVKNNIDQIQGCIKEVKSAETNYGNIGKGISAEIKGKETEKKLKAAELKNNKASQKNLEKQKREVNKNKDYTAEQKATDIERINTQLKDLADYEKKANERMTAIGKELDEIHSRETANKANIQEADSRMELLTSALTQEKTKLAAIKNEIKMVKAQVKAAAKVK